MTPLAGMVAAALGTCAAALAVSGGRDGAAVLAGMAGPLLAAAGTWIAVDRAHRRDPAGVTRVMIQAFVIKVVYFGAYVVLALGALELAAVPFVVSFTAYFIGLYFVEALLFARLFGGRLRPAR